MSESMGLGIMTFQKHVVQSPKGKRHVRTHQTMTPARDRTVIWLLQRRLGGCLEAPGPWGDPLAESPRRPEAGLQQNRDKKQLVFQPFRSRHTISCSKSKGRCHRMLEIATTNYLRTPAADPAHTPPATRESTRTTQCKRCLGNDNN